MATAAPPNTPCSAKPGAGLVARLLGAAVLAATAWRAAGLVAALSRSLGARGFWLEAGVSLPVWVLCWAGGVALFRGRHSGFRALYLAALLLVGGMVASVVPLAAAFLAWRAVRQGTDRGT